MQRKVKIKIFWKNIKFAEMLVWEYWTFIVDYEQFLDDYFEKYNINYKKLSENQLTKIMTNITPKEDEEDIFKKLTKDEEKKPKKELLENFHITIWKFMYAMRLSYKDVMNMPLSIFTLFLEDLEYIIWDKEKKWIKKNNFSWTPEKEKLKRIFSKQ